MSRPLGAFIGFDFSTQQVKAVVTDEQLRAVATESVDFHTQLPHYKLLSVIERFNKENVHKYTTDHGVAHGPVHSCTSPVRMWLEALDLLLDKLHAAVDLSRLRAVSGAGQQHGSVYWKTEGDGVLRALQPDRTLADQLQHCFSVPDSPIWMDSSTAAQCWQLETAVGGAQQLCELTGSRAFHRFTGSQIAKIYQTQPAAYEDTQRISLVSSFGCSLLLGEWAPVDLADASGMNLLDIGQRRWHQPLLDAVAPDLLQRLGQPVPSNTVLVRLLLQHKLKTCLYYRFSGNVSEYYVKRYGWPADCKVVAFTGDNPASLAGLNVSEGELAVSWGTSDTVFVWLTKARCSLGMHVLCNPVQPDQYMGMLCFKNGAFTRDRVRRAAGCADWAAFNTLLQQTPPGNDGHIGFFYDSPEILPEAVEGTHLFDGEDKPVDSLPATALCRAVIEHQCLAKRLHAHTAGYKRTGRLVVTGGASGNASVLTTLADVFQLPVFVQSLPNSAALGSAFRAKLALCEPPVTLQTLCADAVDLQLAATPRPHTASVGQYMIHMYVLFLRTWLRLIQIYDAMLERYERLEKRVTGAQQ